MSTFQVRICSKCGTEKNIDNFQAIKSRNYRLTICRQCESKRKQDWLKSNPIKIEEKRIKGREYTRQYRVKNKGKCKESAVLYKKNNPDKVKMWKRNDYLKRKKICNEKSKEYYEKNKDKIIAWQTGWAEANHEKVKSIKRKYNNSIKGRAARHNYRSLKRANGYKLTEDNIKMLISQQNNKCFYCDKDLENFQIEHIIPLSKGGEHKLYNIVLSCSFCNHSKGHKSPEDFVNKILKEAI